MPQIGDEARANDVGLNGGKYKKCVWVGCPDCGFSRWAHKASTKSDTQRLCKDCVTNRARKFSVATHRET